MCGACGRDRPDWLTAFLSTSYPRQVVAARLSRLGPGATVKAQPSGWSLTGRGARRPVDGPVTGHVPGGPFFATMDGAADELIRRPDAPSDAAAVACWVDKLPPHRPQFVPRDSVPERYQGTVIMAAELQGTGPGTSINRLLGLLLIRLLEPNRPMITRLADDQGLWTFASRPTSP